MTYRSPIKSPVMSLETIFIFYDVVMGLMDAQFDIAVFLKPTRIEPILEWLNGEKDYLKRFKN